MTILFASLDVLDGQIVAKCQKRLRHRKWLKFLRKFDCEKPE
jgi:hypothetical protein